MPTPRPGADAGTLRLGLLAELNLKEDAKISYVQLQPPLLGQEPTQARSDLVDGSKCTRFVNRGTSLVTTTIRRPGADAGTLRLGLAVRNIFFQRNYL
jgi:hypothetical protein